MSVMVLDNDVYEHVAIKLMFCAYNSDRHTINSLYMAAHNNLHDEKTVLHFVNNLLVLNYMSYASRYREKYSKPALIKCLPETNNKTISTYQLLMFMGCIEYQIELSTIRCSNGKYDSHIDASLLNSYKILLELINDTRKQIVSCLPEFKSCSYSTFNKSLLQ